jgi:hypothetical protein
MRQVAINAELHFHEQEVVSIFHESNVSGTDEKFAELVFAGAFAIRSMSNLGMNEVTCALGQQLQLVGQIINDAPDEILTPKPKIVPYPGYQGRKRFVSSLVLTKEQMKLDYSAKGFGLLARGVDYYVPAAVNPLFRYFASRRLYDSEYLNALANISAASGQLQLEQQIQVSNHPQLIGILIVNFLDELMPEWM